MRTERASGFATAATVRCSMQWLQQWQAASHTHSGARVQWAPRPLQKVGPAAPPRHFRAVRRATKKGDSETLGIPFVGLGFRECPKFTRKGCSQNPRHPVRGPGVLGLPFPSALFLAGRWDGAYRSADSSRPPRGIRAVAPNDSMFPSSQIASGVALPTIRAVGISVAPGVAVPIVRAVVIPCPSHLAVLCFRTLHQVHRAGNGCGALVASAREITTSPQVLKRCRFCPLASARFRLRVHGGAGLRLGHGAPH
jgi:hypothetical protein